MKKEKLPKLSQPQKIQITLDSNGAVIEVREGITEKGSKTTKIFCV